MPVSIPDEMFTAWLCPLILEDFLGGNTDLMNLIVIN